MKQSKIKSGKLLLCLAILRKITGKNLFSLLVYGFLLLLYAPPGNTSERLGVVRSQDNAQQWSNITERLQAATVDYCIVETANWKQASDLGKINVLLLPNVSALTEAQAEALNGWMNQGGKVIVTGPTGNLSQPEVRSRLRSLFGAYWGFPINSPSTLNPSQQWLSDPELAATVKGGVVLPAALNSETAAVWMADGKPPAVVTTHRSTFLGWRWGLDTAASVPVDAAWLKAALSRFGTFTPGSGSGSAACSSDSLRASEEIRRPNWSQAAVRPSPTLPEWQRSTIQVPPRTSRGSLSRTQAEAMHQELEGLINRFESALLSTEARNSGIDQPIETVIEQVLNGDKSASRSTPTEQLSFSRSPRRVATEAREKLQRFRQLVEQQDYDQAKQQWVQARQMLWDNYPTEQTLAQSEIRAIWLDRGTIVRARSEADLAKLFDRLAAAGINTVFFETVNASYPVYPSRVAPQQNPLTQGWDPLKAAVKLAHARDMELHAWVWMFAAANQRHNRILGQPSGYLGPLLSAHPDWGITDRQGQRFNRSSQKAFLDPANPEVKQYLLALLDEITTDYQVDGIQLDYIRYPFQNPASNQTSGYSVASRQQFKAITGVDPITLSPRHPLWSGWTNFRIRQVDGFVATASRHLKEKRPELILSTAVFAMPRQQRLVEIQQNWEEWAEREWIDWVVPMTYASGTDELGQLTQPLFGRSNNSTLLLPGIRLLNLPTAIAQDQMQFLRNSPAEGYALFAAENFTPDIQTVLSSATAVKTQSFLPHRQPFQAAAARYQALRQEWGFLLSQNQLEMSESDLKEWGKQADRLAESLDQLAEEPSPRHLSSAQVNLSSFQRQFPRWMEQQSQKQPYQIEVWENRLETLERLLDYGKRTALSKQSDVAER